MANPTDNLPGFAVPGLPPTTAPIPQVQPTLPALAQQTPQPPIVVPPAPAPSQFVPRGPTPYGIPGSAAPVPAAAAAAGAAPAASAAPAATPAAATTNADPTLAARIADVPDGGRLVNLPSAGTPTAAAAAPAAPTPVSAGLTNPQTAISAGYDRQQAYAQNFLDQALQYVSGGGDIFERATRGRAIAGILHAVVGQNNEGSAQASGANGLNSATAAITDAGTMANAQMYGADQNLAANQQRLATQEQLGQMDLQGRTVQTGQTQSFDPATGQYTTISNFAQPQVGQGGMVSLNPINPPTRQAAAPKPVIGARYRDAKGNEAILQPDGTYKAVN